MTRIIYAPCIIFSIGSVICFAAEHFGCGCVMLLAAAMFYPGRS